MVQQPVNELQIVIKAVNYLRTHWWIFLLESLSIFGFGLHIFYGTAPSYESHASLLIDSSRRQLYQSVLMTNTYNQSNTSRRQNMANLLASHEAMERVRTQLTDIYNANGHPGYLRSYFPGGVAIEPELFHSYTNLSWDKNSDVYNLSCYAEDPDAAHDICLAYLNAIQAYYPEVGQRESMMKHEFLRRERKSLTTQITEEENKLTDFKRNNPELITFVVLDLGQRGLLGLQQDEHTLKEKMAINRAVRDMIVRSKSGKSVRDSLEITITALTQRLEDLQYQLQLTQDSKNPNREQRQKDLQAAIDHLSGRLGQLNDTQLSDSLRNPMLSTERTKRLADLEWEYRSDQVKLKGLHEEMASIEAKETRLQSKRLEFERMTKELEHRRSLLTHLYDKEQEMELDLSAGNAEIFRLQEPVRDGTRVAPKLSKNLFGSVSVNIFFIVFTLALLLAFFPRLDSEAEVHRLSIPVLGKVPTMTRTLE